MEKSERIISDEELNDLADTFVARQIGRVLDITFEQYIARPDHYDILYDALQGGNGLWMSDAGVPVVVKQETRNKRQETRRGAAGRRPQ